MLCEENLCPSTVRAASSRGDLDVAAQDDISQSHQPASFEYGLQRAILEGVALHGRCGSRTKDGKGT